MIPSRTGLPLLAAAGALCLFGSAAAQAPQPAPRAAGTGFQEFERVVLAHLAGHSVPGAAVAMVRGDSIVYAKGFGVASLDTRAPVTPDMLFQLGSSSKMFTAVLVAAMASDGTLDLSAPVGRYLSGLPPAAAQLTAHQLLSHSAGLKDEAAESGPTEESALAEFPRSWSDAYAILPAGLLFSYSNPGFALAGAVAQEVGKKPFADLVQQRVFLPLGMTRSTYRPRAALAGPIAAGHAPAIGAAPNAAAEVVATYANDTRFWPAGYAYSSAREFARFLTALLNRGRVGGRQVLPATAVASMMTRHVPVPNIFEDAGYGYALFLGPYRGMSSAWHDGQMPGFGSLVRMLPERRLGVVILLNRGGVRADRIADAAFDALGVPPAPPASPAPKQELAMTPAQMEAYLGRYVNRFPVEIFLRDGALHRRWFTQEQRIYRVGEHRFTVDPARLNRAAEFTMRPASANAPAYVQAFLWAFPRS